MRRHTVSGWSESISPPLPAALASVERLSRDYSKEPPVSDQIFEVYRSLYRYDRGPLNSKVEAVEELPTWRRETVTFDAAYGGERMRAHLFLPMHARPPYQSVVYFPGSDSRGLTSSRELRMRFFEFLIKSGRAVMFPIYKGTYERGPSASASVLEFRDLMLAWGKDLGRSMDYLETRPDIDRGRFAFYGLSLGAEAGVTLTAVEQRFKASILLAGGLSSLRVPGEIDTINFAPRVRVPTLMIEWKGGFRGAARSGSEAVVQRARTRTGGQEARRLPRRSPAAAARRHSRDSGLAGPLSGKGGKKG